MFDARALFLLQFAFFVKIFLWIGRDHYALPRQRFLYFSTDARTRCIAPHFTCKKLESHFSRASPCLVNRIQRLDPSRGLR
jgi:hypothetical protein